MPAAGAKRKPPGQTVHRNPVLEFTEVENVPFTGGPPLPPTRANGEPWNPYIVRKWDAWSTMPHAKLWTKSDWNFAFDSIEAAAKMVASDFTPARCIEVRNREKIMGTTMDYRRDIRIRYIDPKPQTVTAVAQLDDYRDL